MINKRIRPESISHNKYVYVDSEDNIIIYGPFDYAGEFKDGIAFVRKNGCIGSISLKGEIVIPFVCYEVVDIGNNLMKARYSPKGKWGVIDNNNNIILDFKFEDIMSSNGNLFVAYQNVEDSNFRSYLKSLSKDELIIYSKEHKINLSNSFNATEDTYRFEIQKKASGWDMFVIDKEGRDVLNKHFKYIEFIGDGLIAGYEYANRKSYGRKFENLEYCQLFNTSGRFLKTVSFLRIVDDYVFVRDCESNKFGVIDINGSVLVPFIYDDISISKDSFAAVRYNKKWGIINFVTNQILIPCEWDDVLSLSNDVIIVR